MAQRRHGRRGFPSGGAGGGAASTLFSIVALPIERVETRQTPPSAGA